MLQLCQLALQHLDLSGRLVCRPLGLPLRLLRLPQRALAAQRQPLPLEQLRILLTATQRSQRHSLQSVLQALEEQVLQRLLT